MQGRGAPSGRCSAADADLLSAAAGRGAKRESWG